LLSLQSRRRYGLAFGWSRPLYLLLVSLSGWRRSLPTTASTHGVPGSSQIEVGESRAEKICSHRPDYYVLVSSHAPTFLWSIYSCLLIVANYALVLIALRIIHFRLSYALITFDANDRPPTTDVKLAAWFCDGRLQKDCQSDHKVERKQCVIPVCWKKSCPY
jgi:hypothetical protein